MSATPTDQAMKAARELAILDTDRITYRDAVEQIADIIDQATNLPAILEALEQLKDSIGSGDEGRWIARATELLLGTRTKPRDVTNTTE